MRRTVFKNKQIIEKFEDHEEIFESGTTLYPPLFCLHTWTKSVPICVIYLPLILPIKFNNHLKKNMPIFTPQHRIRKEKPSMSIGRNYRLELEKRLRKINISRENNILSSKTLDDRNNFTKPPVPINSKKHKLKNEPDIKTKKYSKSSGFVSLGDLLSGKYYKDKLEAREQKMIRMQMKKEKATEKPQLPPNYTSFLQVCTALSPDEQLNILINKWNKEISNKNISEEDNERIKYYLNEVITDDLYDPYPERVLENIKKYRVRPILLQKHYSVMMELENEIRKSYDVACRKILFDYVTMDPDELKRIRITNYYSSDYSSMLIRGPVPWHHMTIIQKEQLRHNLYIFRESILMLHNVWTKYSKGYIFPIKNLKKVGIPIQPKSLKEFLEKSCEKFRHKLVKEWIVECADLFMKTKDNHQDILPTYGIKASKHQIQKFFDCVAATMSRQLRQIVFKSLKHFMKKILEYKNSVLEECLKRS